MQMTSNAFIERLTWTLVQCTEDGLRSFPVYEKQNYRLFCISSCTSCPCCSQRRVGGISLYKRLLCWTSIHHHPNGKSHAAAERSYIQGHCHRQSLYIKDFFSVPVRLLSLGLSLHINVFHELDVISRHLLPGHGSHHSLEVNTNQNGIFPWERLCLAQGLHNVLVLLKVLNGLVRSLLNAGACCMSLGSNIPHIFQRDPRSLSHVVTL